MLFYRNIKDNLNYFRWIKPRLMSYYKGSLFSPKIIFYPISIIYLVFVFIIEYVYEYLFVKLIYFFIGSYNSIKNFNSRHLILSDIKKNKTCYILGNGPSLKNINLNKLNNKITFTVNHFDPPKYPNFRSTFHVMLDGHLFEKTLKTTKKKIIKEKKTKILIPYDRKDNFKKNLNNLYFFDLLPFKIEEYLPDKIEFNKGLPGSFNVIPFTIALAISLGFKKIYLLGADQTQYIGGKHYIDDKIYYRNETKETKKIFFKKLEKYKLTHGVSNIYGLWSSFRILLAHSKIYNYTKKNNIKIYNCSEKGILDIYPYQKIQK